MITIQPTGGNVPIGNNITLVCQAIGQGPLRFFWEAYNNISDWRVVDASNTTSYTIRTVTDGKFMYRCTVTNKAGSVTSGETSINVFRK